MRKEDRDKPYIYKVYNSRGNLEEYSRYYRTKREAVNWYNTHGKWLEKHFNTCCMFMYVHKHGMDECSYHCKLIYTRAI